MNNPIVMYDMTIPSERFTIENVFSFMDKYCKRWCFQKEKGDETGYIHYQCRISLMSKKRPDNMKLFINEHLKGASVSPSSNPTFLTKDEFYVMKEDTRIEGPWSDRTHINDKTIPKFYRGAFKFRPWQEQVLEMCKEEPHRREINYIYTPEGNQGRSTLGIWMATHGLAHRIPPMECAKDISRLVGCLIKKLGERPTIVIDFPRATKKNSMSTVFYAIEDVKNGYCLDERYDGIPIYFDVPHVWVFGNQMPNLQDLTADRWVFWKIKDDKLVPHLRQETLVKFITLPINTTLGTGPAEGYFINPDKPVPAHLQDAQGEFIPILETMSTNGIPLVPTPKANYGWNQPIDRNRGSVCRNPSSIDHWLQNQPVEGSTPVLFQIEFSSSSNKNTARSAVFQVFLF